MVVRSHFPYWPALLLAVLTTTVAGAVIEMLVIRRLSKAPRVIVLVATIGVAELMQAVVRTLPDYRTGKFQTTFPSPITSKWTISSLGHLHLGRFHAQITNLTITGPQLLAIIIVPLVTVGCGGSSATPFFGEAVAHRPPIPTSRASRHQPQDDVDRDLDHRRGALRHHADPVRDPGAARRSSWQVGPERCCSVSPPR